MSTQNKPNYRIYDRTGGGVTQDIYAETLEDAIEALSDLNDRLEEAKAED